MDQIVEFTGNHSLLVYAFIAAAGLLLWNLITDPAGKHAVVPATATTMINHEDAVVIDVSSMDEYKGGHIINAINIPLNGFKNQLNLVNKYKERPIIVSCRSGSRSNAACKTLREAGFERVYNLRGGMLAWQNDSLPIKRGS